MCPKNQFKKICEFFLRIGVACPTPYFRRNSQIYNSLLLIPVSIQLIVTFFAAVIVFIYPEEFLHHNTIIGAFTDVVQVYGVLFAAAIQAIEQMLKGKLEQSIIESIEKFDLEIFAQHKCRYPHNCPVQRQRSLMPFLISKTIYLLIIPIAIDTAIVLTILDEEERVWRQSICVREFTTIMIRVGLIYIVCHFLWVKIQKLYTVSI